MEAANKWSTPAKVVNNLEVDGRASHSLPFHLNCQLYYNSFPFKLHCQLCYMICEISPEALEPLKDA